MITDHGPDGATATFNGRERPILFSTPMVRAILAGRKTQTRRVINFDRARLKPRETVQSDTMGLVELAHATVIANAGRPYPIAINPHGAISARVGGKWLGMRPGEFDFVCPYASGVTHLEHGARRWHIRPHAGQRLWVRETWQAVHYSRDFETGHVVDATPAKKIPASNEHGRWTVAYAATDYLNEDAEERGFPWRPGIHMPRWASRITLDVVGVRVERLHDISEDDARAEGIDCTHVGEWTWNGKSVKGRPWAHSYFILWNEINGRESWDANPWVWVVGFKRLEEARRG